MYLLNMYIVEIHIHISNVFATLISLNQDVLSSENIFVLIVISVNGVLISKLLD